MWAPEDLPRFEGEFHQALVDAARTFDIAAVEGVLERWRRIAAPCANSLTDEEQGLLRRWRAGEDTGLWEQAEDGTFNRLG